MSFIYTAQAVQYKTVSMHASDVFLDPRLSAALRASQSLIQPQVQTYNEFRDMSSDEFVRQHPTVVVEDAFPITEQPVAANTDLEEEARTRVYFDSVEHIMGDEIMDEAVELTVFQRAWDWLREEVDIWCGCPDDQPDEQIDEDEEYEMNLRGRSLGSNELTGVYPLRVADSELILPPYFDSLKASFANYIDSLQKYDLFPSGILVLDDAHLSEVLSLYRHLTLEYAESEDVWDLFLNYLKRYLTKTDAVED